MNNGNENHEDKEADKKIRKKKRDSVRKKIKAAKFKPNPPMVFTGIDEDMPKPSREIQRTPPKTRKDSSPTHSQNNSTITAKKLSGPVQRSPPRQIEPDEITCEQVNYHTSPLKK